MLPDNLTYIFIGAGVGLVSAIGGAAVDYLIARRRKQDRQSNGGPGCLLIVAGGLGLTGLVVTALSWLLTRSIWLAVMAGIGVLLGFFVGFAILFIGSVLWAGRDS